VGFKIKGKIMRATYFWIMFFFFMKIITESCNNEPTFWSSLGDLGLDFMVAIWTVYYLTKKWS
jgi:uncharacterized membrane protein YhaH (DUF805 family)